MLKADLHIHTEYSMDCSMSLESIVERCLELGVNCIAIADHGTIAGALRMREIAPFPVVVAEEVLTPYGEIMGLFLTEEVPSPIPTPEAVDRIKAQGGLVGIPHPFDCIRRSALGREHMEELLPHIDIIEVFNSRNTLSRDSVRARSFAEKHGLPASAGSDAHTLYEIGHAYVEMPEFNGRDEFLQALAQGRVVGHRSTPLIHLVSGWAKLRSALQGR